MKHNILDQFWKKGIDPEKYYSNFESASKLAKSGNLQVPYVDYYAINFSRFKRQIKKHKIPLKNTAAEIKALCISEFWCGDAAQNLPAIFDFCQKNNIQLKLVLRDDDTTLIDHFLTNGGRSIPKLILFDSDKTLATWGPRPKKAQEYIELEKAKNTYNAEGLHRWYLEDNMQEVYKELNKLLIP